jgi:hypothetical protein
MRVDLNITYPYLAVDCKLEDGLLLASIGGSHMMLLRDILCCVMIFFLPASLMAAEPGAMVYGSGSTLVNGVGIPRSSVIFPGDIVQTRASSQANISVAGASVTIFENSSVKFEATGVVVQEGSARVGTKKQDMTTKAGIISVAPASSTWTEFEMSHRNGAVQIIARKGDVHINEGTETVTLLQGQSTTRDDSATSDDSNRDDREKKKRRGAGAGPAPAASNPVLDSPVWIGVGSGAILGGLIYALTRSGEPVSPITP